MSRRAAAQQSVTPARGSRLERVLAYGDRHLGTLLRRSGESYAEHGKEIAKTLRELTNDPSLAAVSILHDLLVHPDGDELLAASPLTNDERTLVEHLHPLRRLHIDANTEDLDLAISAFTQDARLLPLRMAHRLNDVRHLDRFSVPLRKQIARESLQMYAAIAGRLGIHAWRYEMEDTCFPMVQPGLAKKLQTQYSEHEAFDLQCLKQARNFLAKKLRSENISCRFESRIKGLYSTYRKMTLKNRAFADLTDRLALRIVVQDRSDCYRVLGIVHASLHPIPGKLKDYIGAPKENGYRSIHTVVYPLPGVTEQPIEIQIRSETMQRECEYGAPNHGDYKNYLYALETGPARVHLLASLEILREENRSPQQFEAALRTYYQQDHIALFDSKGTLYHLKQPLSVLDFACQIFPKRCGNLASVRINGRERPFGTLLQAGDTLEPRFTQKRQISESWLSACQYRKSKLLLKSLL